MIFKSRQVNLDPWWVANVRPGMLVPGGGLVTPRPEFEPTRDPEPWQWSTQPEWRTADATRIIKTAGRWVWAPRREQFDTPVNPALVHFRQMHGFKPGDLLRQAAIAWSASLMHMALAGACTIHEAEHARRVLTRLANWGAS